MDTIIKNDKNWFEKFENFVFFWLEKIFDNGINKFFENPIRYIRFKFTPKTVSGRITQLICAPLLFLPLHLCIGIIYICLIIITVSLLVVVSAALCVRAIKNYILKGKFS